MRLHYSFFLTAGLLALTTPGFAQRTDNNAVTASGDAFGKSVGDEQIGIYNQGNVRGFSPSDAGNLRIEGLYFDQQGGLTDRLINGSTIHVGISAQGYPFPAPTGIADYELRRPGKKRLLSIGLNYGPFGGKSAEFDVQLPLDGDRLGIAGGAGIYRETNGNYSTGEFLSLAVLGRYKPREGIEIIPFVSRIQVRDEEAQTLIFTSGAFLPPRIPRDRFLGQPWADFAANITASGIVARADPLGFDVRLGAFRSVFASIEDHADLQFGVGRDGKATSRQIVVDAGNRFASTSGELRVAKIIKDGPRRHTLIVSAKGRQQDRRFGGDAIVDLGPSQIGVQDFRPEPTSVIGSKTNERVTQKTIGIGYQGRWAKIGELSLGMQKTDYRKGGTAAKPVLLSANVAAYVTNHIAIYGGYARGLEEAPVAPFEALNRNQAPAAIQTVQKEAGVRWNISKGVTAVIGVFDIAKPYFNLDSSKNFRQLAQQRNRGVEFSLAGQIAPGFSIVVGNVFNEQTVTGEAVTLGLIGRKPVGAFVRHTTINLDYKLAKIPALSFSANIEATSDRTANDANTVIIPARAVLNLGARYKFKLGDAPAQFKVNVGNVLNTFGWNVGGSGFFTPNGKRRISMSLSTDL